MNQRRGHWVITAVGLAIAAFGCQRQPPAPPQAAGGVASAEPSLSAGSANADTVVDSAAAENGGGQPQPTGAVDRGAQTSNHGEEGTPDPASADFDGARFQGEDQEPTAPIPPAIQQALQSYGTSIDRRIELLLYPHPEVRRQAAAMLAYIDEEDRPRAAPALRGALLDPVAAVRGQAADALAVHASVQPELAQPALPELIRLIGDADDSAANSALSVLMELGPLAAPALPRLMEDVNDPEHPNRVSIIRTLGRIGPEARGAVLQLAKEMESFGYTDDAAVALGRMGAEATLLRGLSHEDEHTRRVAAEGAGYLAQPSREIVQRLIAIAARDPYEYARSYAAESLGKVRPGTAEIAAALMKAAEDPDSAGVRRAAVEALGEMEPRFNEAIPAIIAASSDADEWVRSAAVTALGKYEDAAEARLQALLAQALERGGLSWDHREPLQAGVEEFAPLLRAIADDDQQDEPLRAIALYALWHCSSGASQDRANTLALAKSWISSGAGATLRAAGAFVAAEIEYEAPPDYTPHLLAGLKEAKLLGVRTDAAGLLGEMEHEDNEAIVKALIQALDDQDTRIVAPVAKALGQFGADAGEAAPAIVRLASDPDLEERSTLVRALGDIAAAPNVAFPLLTKMLKEEDDDVWPGVAALAMAKIIVAHDLDAAPLLNHIVPLLSDPEFYFESGYVEALAELGPQAAPCVPALRRLLHREDEHSRRVAANVLGAIGPEAKEAAAELAAAAATWSDPASAIAALGQIKHGGEEFAKVAPKLLDTVELRSSVLETLGELGPDAKAALPAVVDILDSQDEYERMQALETLGRWGAAAADALPRIKQAALEDEDEDVRAEAGRALLTIAPDDPANMEILLAEAADKSQWELESLVGRLGDDARNVVAQGLKSEHSKSRLAALRLLPQVLSEEVALTAYERILADADPHVRGVAAQHLWQAGRRSPELVSLLVDRLGAGDSSEVERMLAEAGRAAFAPLAQVIADERKEAAAKRAAAQAIGYQHRPPRMLKTMLAPALASQDPDTRFWAAAVLAPFADDPSADAILAEALGGDDRRRREDALAVVNRMDGPLSPAIRSALFEVIAGDDEDAAEQAVYSLHYIRLAKGDVAMILPLLDDAEKAARAARLLQNGHGVRDPQVASRLAERLRAADEDAAAPMADALARQGSGGRQALAAVLVEDRPLHVRQAAATALLNPDGGSAPLVGEEVEKAAALLEDAPDSLAGTVAVLLARSGYDLDPLAPKLLALLQEEEGRLPYHAAEAIRSRAADAQGLLPALIELAATSESEQKRLAVDVLGVVGKDSPEARQTIFRLIRREPESYLRVHMAQSLVPESEEAEVHRGVEWILAELQGAEGEELGRLLGALRGFYLEDASQAADLAGQVAPYLSSDDPAVRREAALTLAHFKADGDPLVDALLNVLDEEDARGDAVRALGELGPRAKRAVPRLIELLDDPQLADMAMWALGSIGPDAAPAVPHLAALLETRFHSAAQALEGIGPAAEEAVPMLLAQLESESRIPVAARALAKIKPDALLPALYGQMRDPHRRYAAVEAVAVLENDAAPAVPVLVKALARDDVDLQIAALRSLGGLGEVASEAAPRIAPLLDHADAEVSRSAADALGRIQAPPELAVPALLKALHSDHLDLKRAAAQSLGRFGEAAAPGVEPLRAWLDDPQLAGAAANALGQIGPAAAPAAPELMRLAVGELPGEAAESDVDEHDDASYRRHSAIRALGQIGPAAAGAVPELVKLHETEEPHLRRAVGSALWKIDPAAAEQAGAPPPTE